ncbi:MAG: type II toxin-antitoxin system PrlF family antitoxin [Pseudomonadales bacterium]|jgi:bifunctional DNA-binding transcriptional regulator/antitoxin component of YhaV-PrlF toxin-antitoxin module|nr:type II toxin-antitoxin system PrlF family antitoxin [Pseudomonadales bacterium]
MDIDLCGLAASNIARRGLMAESTITSRGQTTIPHEVRRQPSLCAGQGLSFTVLPDGAMLVRMKDRRIDDVIRCLAREGEETVPTAGLSR